MFPLGEIKNYKHIIAKDPKLAFEYSALFDSKFPEGEAAIATMSEYAWLYCIRHYYNAQLKVQKRFYKGEAAISSDPRTAFNYAQLIIQGCWPEGENAINSDPHYKEAYKSICKNSK